jgi:antitoxin component YwqK of YwqJK toxin-antitoxin module
VEYILNSYLDYEEDIMKLKQLYKYKFNIKAHITYIQKSLEKCILLDKNLIRKKEYYSTGNLFTESNYKNNKLHGTNKRVTYDGKIILYDEYKDGKCIKITKKENGIIIDERILKDWTIEHL